MHAILLFAFLLSSSSWAFDPNCQTDAIQPVDTPITPLAQRLSRNCSFTDLYTTRNGEAPDTESFNPRSIEHLLYESSNNDELCECLNSPGLLLDTLPTPEVQIQPNAIEQATLSVFREELLNLQANVAKVKNLNLHSSLHESSKDLCSAAQIQSEVQKIKQKIGSPDCQISEGIFNSRVQPLFNGLPEQISEKLNEMAVNVPTGYCISRAEYARLRSSNSFAYIGLRLFRKGAGSLFNQALIHDDTFSAMLPYDVLFDLAFRYGDVQEKIHQRYAVLSENLNPFEVVDAIYNDLDVQKAVFEGVEKQCGDFTKNIERYICNPRDVKLEPKTASLVSSISLGKYYTEPVKQAVIDFVTKNNSCKQPAELGGHDKLLNDYIQERGLQSRLVQGPFSENNQSDYNRFNQQFCGNVPQPFKPEYLSDITKQFIQQKQSQGNNLLAVLSSDETAGLLGFKIDLNADPVIVPDLPDGEFPKMDKNRWDMVKDQLNLSEEDTAQLYALLEMQTNSRSRELADLKRQYEGANPGIPELSPQAYDQILRSPPGTVIQIPGTNQTIVVNSVQQTYQQQQDHRQERFSNSSSNNRSSTVNNFAAAMATQVGSTAAKLNETNIPAQEASETQVSTDNVAELSNKRSPVTQATVVGVPAVSGISGIGTSSGSVVSSVKTEIDRKQKPVVSSVSSSDTSTTSPTRVDTSAADKIKTEIKQIQDEIAKKQQEFDSNNRSIQRLTKLRDAASSTPDTSAQTTFRQSYNYPRNLPVRTESGQYYQSDAEGSELSSASGIPESSFVTNKPQVQERSSRSGSVGSASTASASVSKGGSGGTIGATGGGATSSAGGRGPASVDSKDEKLREELNLPVYEFPRYIPQSMIDMMGSIEKVVLLLGLEGKQFKTIEAIEEIDPNTGKPRIRYYERIYDFVPGQKYSEFAKAMKDKTERAKLYETYFTYKRSPASLVKSKSYAKATKEVHKEEVLHSYVLENQNKILSEEEIRAKIAASMELLK